MITAPTSRPDAAPAIVRPDALKDSIQVERLTVRIGALVAGGNVRHLERAGIIGGRPYRAT